MAHPPKLPVFKRGDSFALTCTFKYLGQPYALNGYTIRAHLRTLKEELVCELVAAKAPDQVTTPGRFFLTPADQSVTKGWPAPGNLICEIEFTVGGVVHSTQTFLIPIERDVTV